jgi:hypothetical protein
MAEVTIPTQGELPHALRRRPPRLHGGVERPMASEVRCRGGWSPCGAAALLV